uniref:uncharacterized protein n=1 Tax=Semicossyphus pulcher TaxID=241346 RepID=UPI0037E84DD6
MELKRSVRVWIAFALLIFGNNATAVLGRNLDCTNDFEKFLSCHIEAQNCTEYSLTLVNHNGIGVDPGAPGQGCSPQGIDHRIEPSYIFKQCDNGQCCCSAQLDVFYSGDDYTAKVWKRDIMEDCKVIDITASIKPKTPTIISVNESNGNFQVVWLKNMKDILSKTLKAEVTYHVKGDTHKEPKFVDQTTDGETNDYEILGRDLKPSTTYVVSVKSFTEWSGKFSDSSEEYEFTT